MKLLMKVGRTAMLKAPRVDHYISVLKSIPYRQFGSTHSYDEKSYKLLDELFELIKQLKPISKDGARMLWLKADRGDITDFGDYEEWLEEEMCNDYDDFKDTWLSYYPNETKWYEFQALEDEEIGFRAVTLEHRYILEDDKREERSPFPLEISEFMIWLVESVKTAINEIKTGTYNDTINKELPPENKTGTIVRKDYWDVFPSAREDFFKNLTEEDKNEFCRLAYSQTENSAERIDKMTANDFYYFFSLGYKENNYNGCEKTPKEQYYLHADGRDNELSEINADSPEEFEKWYYDEKRGGGHPWEVCRGGNSTHVALYVCKDENGYYLRLAGDAWNRTIETVKFFLALKRNNIPVYLEKAKILADRLMETEKIGIVPQGVIPAYCESFFPDKEIIDYMNLPYEKEDVEKILPFCTWYPLEKIELL